MPNIRRVVARHQARNQERNQAQQVEPPVAYLNESQAESCLMMYCDEHGIDIDRLPSENIDRFLDTIRYAPSEISNREIANDCGITVENYTQESTPSEVGRLRGSLSDIDDFSEWYSNAMRYGDRRQPPTSASDLVEQIMAETPTLTRQGSGVAVNLSNMVVSDSIFQVSMPKKKRKPQRSERDMMMEIVRGEDFPKPDFKDWSSNRELQTIINDWFSNIEYREQWIFSRREREGFNRRNVGMFNLDDVMARMTKRKNGHPLDTEKSKFYDWKLGGTDWTLRLELYQHEQYHFLISRYIHKPSHVEIKYDVRYWDGNSFKVINTLISNERNHEHQFEQAFGSNNPDSDYYVEPYIQEEVDAYFGYSNESDDNDFELEELDWEE